MRECEILLGAVALAEAIHIELADKTLEFGVTEEDGEDGGLEEGGVKDGKGSASAIP